MCHRAKLKSNKAFVKFISPAKGYFRESYKSQNINPISATPKLTLDIIQIKVKSLSTSSIKINLSVQFQYLTITQPNLTQRSELCV